MASNTYGQDSELQKLRAERDAALLLVKKMKDCFLTFQSQLQTKSKVQATIDAQKQSASTIDHRGQRSDSTTSLRSINSIRSQRYVKLKVKQVKTNSEKDTMISSLQDQNQQKDDQIEQMRMEMERLRAQIN